MRNLIWFGRTGASALLTAWLISFPNPGWALDIVLTDAGGASVGSAVRTAFEVAAGRWEALVLDPITVRIDVGFQMLAPGVLGQSATNTVGLLYGAVRDALFGDQTSLDDSLAAGSLQPGSSLAFYTNDAFGSYTLDNDLSANNRHLDVSRANAKALGLLGDDGSTDATITFNSDLAFDFDPENGIALAAYDLVGVSAHEIGHALGFVSGVDVVDFYSPSGPGVAADLNPFRVFSVLDLFRYSSAAGLDLSYGGAPYFSIDAGATSLGAFATGVWNGDGRQASHWKDNQALGLMDPTASPGAALEISALDLRAIDVIGWNLLPEPSPLALLGSGLIGLAWRGGLATRPCPRA